jgi:hypothetical protein
MKGRTILLVPVLAILGACSGTPSEPANDQQLWIVGNLQNEDGGAGYRFDVIYDGRMYYAALSGGSGYGFNITSYDMPVAPGRHTLELRFLEQPVSPATYRAWGWTLKRLGPREAQLSLRVLSETDLPEQTVPVATGGSIRWGFDM